jgi:hypothetical protein
MPSPVSVMVKSTKRDAGFMIAAVTLIFPFSVNFTALWNTADSSLVRAAPSTLMN